MHRSRFMGYCIGVLMIGSAIATPASAQTNQSDISGTNVFSTVAPDFFADYQDVLSPEDLAEAQRLSDELDDSYEECVASQAVVVDIPRRFAVGPGPSTPCLSAACVQFNTVLEETRTFLSRVGALTEEVESAIRDRPW